MANTTLVSTGFSSDQTYNYPIDIWLGGGQSNQDTRAEMIDLPSEYSGLRNGQIIFHKPSINSDPNGSWKIMQAGVNNYNPTWPTPVWGWDIPFMQNMFAHFKRNIGMIKYGQGSTCMANNGGTFNPNVASSSDSWVPSANELSVRFLDWYVRPALQQLINAGIPYIVRGILWFQGECDSGSAANAAAYQANFLSFKSLIEADPLINNPNLIWIDFECQTANLVNMATINTAKQNIQAMFPDRYKFIPKTGWTYQDGVHLDAASYILAGNTAAEEARLLM